MSAHTPGPWSLHPAGIPYVNCGDDGPAFGPVVMAKSLEEIMANARLIATAPDMLDAMRAVVAALSGRVHSQAALAALAQCEDTIAKATGA